MDQNSPDQKWSEVIISFFNDPARRRSEEFEICGRKIYIRRGVFGFDISVNDYGPVWEALEPILDCLETEAPLRIEFIQDPETVGNLMLHYGWHLYGDSHEQGAPCFVNNRWKAIRK